MAIQKRLLVIGTLLGVILVLYGAASYYSPALVFYVVEQSLLQKAPPGTDAALLHERLRAHISAAPDKNSQMEKLLRISEYLEKVQSLTFRQLDEILAVKKPGTSHFLRRSSRYDSWGEIGGYQAP